MKKEIDPQRLHLSALAQAGERLVGDERIAHFPRLLEETRGVGAESRVHYVAQAEVRTASDGAHQVWLKVSAEVTLSLICQRCLGPVDVLIQFDREFRFVATEEQAEAEDDVSEEDVLVISRAFNLLTLIEDEVLMALPVAPMHETCPTPIVFGVEDADFQAPEDDKPNPFAVLQQLKRNGPH